MARKLKRFLLFAGEHYYPQGGVNDLQNSFTTLEEARVAANSMIRIRVDIQWANILDTNTGEKWYITSSGEVHPYAA